MPPTNEGVNGREISFGIVEGNKCASIWKLKTNKNSPDVYLSSNNLGTIHVSMHQDGRWHIKFGKLQEKIAMAFNQPVTDAYLEKWIRPSEVKPRITVALRIHTPHPSPQKKRGLIIKPFVEIPNAPAGLAVEVIILIISPNTELRVPKDQLVGTLNLSNDEMVVILYKILPINIPLNLLNEKLQIPDFTERLSFRDVLRGSFGTIFFGKASDDSRMLWDIAIDISLMGYIKILKKKIKRSILKMAHVDTIK